MAHQGRLQVHVAQFITLPSQQMTRARIRSAPLLSLQVFVSTEDSLHFCEHGVNLLIVILNGGSPCSVVVEIEIQKLAERRAAEAVDGKLLHGLDEILEVLRPSTSILCSVF